MSNHLPAGHDGRNRLPGRIAQAVLPKSWFRNIRNVRIFFQQLSRLESFTHVEHFGEIHRLWLDNRWTKLNAVNLMLRRYHDALGEHTPRAFLRAQEFKVFSQNGEDGIILHLLANASGVPHSFVNIGGGGATSNTMLLASYFGWQGVEIDGNEEALHEVNRHYGTQTPPPVSLKSVPAWLTTDNINQVLRDAQMEGDIGLLSLDIDGNDYWIWQALTAVHPAVAVIEYNASFGPTRSVTIPYDAAFNINAAHASRWYHGASLTALTKLAHAKGLALVGCESNGVNAFFARRDLLGNGLAEMTPAEAYYPHFQRPGEPESQFATISSLPLITI